MTAVHAECMRVAKAAQAVLRWTLAFGGIPSDAEKELHAALAEAGYLVPDLPEQQPPEPAARKPKQRPCVPSPEPAAQDRLYWTAKDLAYRWGPRHHEDQDHCADEIRVQFEKLVRQCADLCMTHNWCRDIEWWRIATKKEVSAEAARQCSAILLRHWGLK